jgi:hypothetical protein
MPKVHGEKHVMLVGFVFVHYSLQHGFEDFVDGLNLTIGLWVVWGSELMSEA